MDGRGWQRTFEDGRGLSKTTGNGERWRVTAYDGQAAENVRVMSHEVKTILLEVYDLNLARTGGPSARTIVPYIVCPVLTFPRRSPSLHPQRDGL